MNSSTLSKAFRCSDCAVRIAGRRVVIPLRSFSNSSIRRKHGAVPKFTEVSSTELQDLLTKVRERVFLPAHLSQEQRDLIFNPRKIQNLEGESAKATIAGEDFILKPLDITKNVPGRASSLRRAILLMTETRDWNNLPNLLQGLKTVGFDIKKKNKRYRNSDSAEYVVHQAGKSGQQAILLECLRRADETGLTLDNQFLVMQVFFWMQQKAMRSDWDAGSTKTALLWAELIKDLMQDPKHQLPVGSKPLHNLHEVNGILLELAAVRAVKHLDGKDVDGKVEKHARKLLESPRDLEARREPDTDDDKRQNIFLNFWLSNNAMVAHGIKLAQTVLGPSSELSAGLKQMHGSLEPLLSKAREELSATLSKRGEVKTGVRIHDELLGLKAL
ncbi:uncharacterized protein RCO7_08985 [Rhynchosporium graminicola]|uniref:Uncharacterized protein n=1 Tax=Rhynchosporium graminicola TaxID=2792576 RepID=A0A1E1JU86_9HELO|nr:uncharacterized protein RCO7_08985 [Rhynchosporium commune]